MKCDFCEFEDNVSKLNKYKHPDGWIAVQVHDNYTKLHACPKCARILLICTAMADRIGARAGVSEASDAKLLEKFFPNFKRKEDTDE